MSTLHEMTTATVMLRANIATVYASSNPGGVLTRVAQFSAETESNADEVVAKWLEDARRAGTLGRWILVASAPRIEHVCGMLTAVTRELLADTRVDDLTSVPPEDLRSLLPPAAWV